MNEPRYLWAVRPRTNSHPWHAWDRPARWHHLPRIRYVLAEGPEWDALMERARAVYERYGTLIGRGAPVSEALADLIAYLERER